MNVVGIDLSTFAVDIVKVPYEDAGQPVWHRFDLVGEDAFDRTRSVADSVPGRASVFWDDVVAVGIEEPAGRNPGVIFRVQGAVISCLPARMLVEKLMPAQWRKAVGLAGNASKGEVFEFALFEHARFKTVLLEWSQDACDAYCIALATRSLIQEPQAA